MKRLALIATVLISLFISLALPAYSSAAHGDEQRKNQEVNAILALGSTAGGDLSFDPYAVAELSVNGGYLDGKCSTPSGHMWRCPMLVTGRYENTERFRCKAVAWIGTHGFKFPASRSTCPADWLP